MSVNGSADVVRLGPRAVRLRNRCLAMLANRRTLPPPSDEELSAIGEDIRLSEAWAQWEKAHTPPTGIAELPLVKTKPPVRPWRSPRMYKTAAVAAAAILGFVVGDRWLPRADGQAHETTAVRMWSSVTDSAAASVNAKLLAIGDSDESDRVSLSATDVAALVFRSPRRRHVAIDSLEARIDSVVWIRGRLRGGSRFELAGDVRIVRRGLAELRIDHMVIDGVDADSARVARMVVGVRSRSADWDRMRFEVPGSVEKIGVASGTAIVILRQQSER